ncbi:uncharacterized protein LOC108678079 isoform X2 [Hyalella azteca]|uniref:Uncharacterized protein LOC108678079 isoform X2 n=1 Tax=Hyalella azteca TaxID=294128 RepID=A0A8B7P6X3_HYAAZ|nr:uncharacterized protein LOC108678079 isoform X2 [Hyalella azteca]
MNTPLAVAISIVFAAAVHADYGGGGHDSHHNVIVMPASMSKAYPWVGFGDHYAGIIPKFFKAPRWLPYHDPTYTASWVPFAPQPRSKTYSYNSRSDDLIYADNGFINLDSIVPKGFGPPKGSSVTSGFAGGQEDHYLRRNSFDNQESFAYYPEYTANHRRQFTPFVTSVTQSSNRQNSRFNNLLPLSTSQFLPSHNVLRDPIELQLLDRNSDQLTDSLPRFPVLEAAASLPKTRQSVFWGNLQPTLHVGSRQPGAASPQVLGIDYSKPKSDDIVGLKNPQLTTSQDSGRTSVPQHVQSFESVVSASYKHS